MTRAPTSKQGSNVSDGMRPTIRFSLPPPPDGETAWETARKLVDELGHSDVLALIPVLVKYARPHPFSGLERR